MGSGLVLVENSISRSVLVWPGPGGGRMQVPGSNFVAAVERMSRALEQLASAPSATAVLQEVVRCAASTLGLERAAITWSDVDGVLLTQAMPGLSPEAVAACGRCCWRPRPRSRPLAVA